MTEDRAATNTRAPHVSFMPMTASMAADLCEPLSKIDPWALYGYTPEALSAYLTLHEADAPRRAILVDGAIAGAIGIRLNWLRGPYLQFLGILPAYQRRGVGRVALAWLEGEARAQRAQNLWVVTSDFNLRAQAFYERFGYTRVGTLDALVSEDHAEILFRKRLLPL